MALETKSMNERKRRPTYLPGRWIHKLCGLKRNIVLVNKTDYHVKFTIKKIPSCKCFMSTCKILLPSGAGIEGQFENQENQEIQEISLGPMTDEYIDHVVYLLPSKNVLVTLEMEGKMIFKNRKMWRPRTAKRVLATVIADIIVYFPYNPNETQDNSCVFESLVKSVH